MTMAPEKVEELLGRVRKAEHDSRVLDFRIARAIKDIPSSTDDDLEIARQMRAYDKFRQTPGGGAWYEVPEYSSSIDACLSLLGEVLPGWWWLVGNEVGATIGASDWSRAEKSIDASAKTPPLALLDCILQALLSQQDVKETTP